MPKVFVSTSDGKDAGIELDGDNWELGKYSTMDLIQSIFNYNNITQSMKNMNVFMNVHYLKMKNGDLITILIFSIIALLLTMLFSSFISQIPGSNKESTIETSKSQNNLRNQLDEEKEPPRDFTLEQLRKFDGTNFNPIFISLKFEVFDVSSASGFYGPGSGYHCFAGREASRAMAKLSFEESDLASTDLSDLNSFDKDILEDWYQKFKYYKAYPVVGRVSVPPTDLQLTKDELKHFKGVNIIKSSTTTKNITTSSIKNNNNNTSNNDATVTATPSYLPEKLNEKMISKLVPATASYLQKLDPPLYLSINKKILDVSYGGKDMYGPDSGYHLFTGIDCSKSLAKMKFDEIFWNDNNLTDLTPDELKVLEDWDKKLCSKYPVIGRLVD